MLQISGDEKFGDGICFFWLCKITDVMERSDNVRLPSLEVTLRLLTDRDERISGAQDVDLFFFYKALESLDNRTIE